eukprot:1852098-Amphidinium_carterae.1
MQPAALHPQPHSGNPLGSRIDSSSRKRARLQLVDHLCLDVVSQDRSEVSPTLKFVSLDDVPRLIETLLGANGWPNG